MTWLVTWNILAAVNIMSGKAIFRMEVGLYTKITYGPYEFLYTGSEPGLATRALFVLGSGGRGVANKEAGTLMEGQGLFFVWGVDGGLDKRASN